MNQNADKIETCSQMHKTKVLTVQFQNHIAQSEVSAFRGAINAALPLPDVAYHNHNSDGSFNYEYPHVQYKRIGGKAAIVWIDKEIQKIGDFLYNCDFDINIGDRELHLDLAQVRREELLVQIEDCFFTYTLRKWLSLNQENYKEYGKLEGLAEQCAFLESILIGNMLSFAKGIDVHFDGQVKAHILAIDNVRTYRYKDKLLQGFDIIFKSNVNLPDYIGLGQKVSEGFGMVKKMEENTEREEDDSL